MQIWTKTPQATLKIGFLLFDRFSNLCLANCLEPMRAANALAPHPVFDWRFLSCDGAPVRSSSDLEVMASSDLASAGQSDVLFVLASYDYLRHDTSQTRRLLRDAARRVQTLVALDSAPWLVAAAGLLDKRKATIHWDLLDSFSERFHRVDTQQARVVHDGSRVTCAGALSALDLTLGLIRDHLGHAMQMDIETLFIRQDPPLSSDPTHGRADPAVDRALALMRANIETPMPVVSIAQALSIQPRTLDRHFRAALGASPGVVYRHIRLSAGRQLCENTALPIADIALRCGYETPAAFTRAFRARFGLAPRALRQS